MHATYTPWLLLSARSEHHWQCCRGLRLDGADMRKGVAPSSCNVIVQHHCLSTSKRRTCCTTCAPSAILTTALSGRWAPVEKVPEKGMIPMTGVGLGMSHVALSSFGIPTKCSLHHLLSPGSDDRGTCSPAGTCSDPQIPGPRHGQLVQSFL